MSGPAIQPQVLTSLTELHRLGRHAELEQAARRLLGQHPRHGFLWKALGVACAALGKDDESLAAKRHAAQLLPDDAEAHGNLANALGQRGRYDEAVACLERVAALLPQSAQAHNHLGNMLRDAHRMPEARRRYEQALELRPDFPEALSNLGNTLADLGLVHGAERRYRQAIALLPDRAEIHSNLGNLLKDQGRLAEAQAEYRAAVALDPGFAGGHSNLLLALNHDPDLPAATAKAQAQRFGQFAMARAGAPLAERRAVASQQTLRVGFVSGDLRNHPVGYFLEGFLAHVDPSRLRLFAYPTVARADALTARIQPRFEQWRSIAHLDDEAAARLVRSDGVDVLVDLAGHTAHNRLGLFAWRPAAVQATWLGYFATTGLGTMDWLLADECSVPPSDQGHFTERIWYLPRTRLCFQPPADAPPVAPLPALSRGTITFGSFQNLGKVGDRVLEAWGRVMQAVPGSRLRLQNGQLADPHVQGALRSRLGRAGIDPDRTVMRGRESRRAYLQAHAEVDIVLDTFPYPGGTTTCEALWMGVPTLTLRGDRMLSRQGASLLGAAGLGAWVADDIGQYVQIAARAAADLPALAALRASLRGQVQPSALFDGAAFAADFTEAMRGMSQPG